MIKLSFSRLMAVLLRVIAAPLFVIPQLTLSVAERKVYKGTMRHPSRGEGTQKTLLISKEVI